MGLSLGRLSEDAARVQALERQIVSGDMVHDLDPLQVEPSFVEDRLARTADPEFRRLVDSIATTGQQVPILVRPHPDHSGKYQVAYGHRRLSACSELGRPVKALVRVLSNAELVVAQGKENAERRNLSFIERAMFARHLEEQGFERGTIQTALAVHPAEMTRLLSVARSIPAPIIDAIGSAPRAGRPRWMELATLLGAAKAQDTITDLVSSPAFRKASTDARFDLAIEKLRGKHDPAELAPTFKDSSGTTVVRTERTSTALRLIVDLKLAPGLDEYLLTVLPEIIAGFPRD
jgi:ParB family chromosome partitioning protein